MPQQSLYSMGYKYCSGCETFYKTAVIKCTECNTKLRSKPKRPWKPRRTAQQEFELPGQSWLTTRKNRLEQYIESLI